MNNQSFYTVEHLCEMVYTMKEIILRMIVCNKCHNKFYDMDDIILDEDEVICNGCKKAKKEKGNSR
jgi:formylmethanofuran dehydrogenase subunit E